MSLIGVETVVISFRFLTTPDALTVDAAFVVLVVHGLTRAYARSIRLPIFDMVNGSLPLMMLSVGTLDWYTTFITLIATA